MKFLHIFLCQILLFCIFPFSLFANAEDFSVDARFNKSALRVEEEIEYELTLKWKGNASDYDILPLDSFGLVGLTLQGSRSIALSQLSSEGYITKKIIYRMKAEDEGKAKVAGFEIKLLRKSDGEIITQQVPPLEIEVLPAGKKILEKNLPSRRLLAILLIFISLISFAIATYLFAKRKKNQKEVTTKPTHVNKTPHEQFALDVKSYSPLLYAGDYKGYLTQIEKSLTKWVEITCNKTTKCLSSTFLGELQHQRLLTPECHKVLSEFCQKYEAVKFAGEKISREELDRLTNDLMRAITLGTTSQGK